MSSVWTPSGEIRGGSARSNRLRIRAVARDRLVEHPATSRPFSSQDAASGQPVGQSETRTVDAGQRAQVTLKPLVKLNVLAVQNAAALRYQHWYVREPGAVTSPTPRSPNHFVLEPLTGVRARAQSGRGPARKSEPSLEQSAAEKPVNGS